MSISRRQFFRGLVGQNPDPSIQRQRRTAAVDAFVRANLLPYDFPLTPEQTDQALIAARNEVDLDSSDDVLRWESRLKIREVVDAMVEGWRTEYLRAEELRQESGTLVAEYLAQASAEDLDALRGRFHIPYPAVLEEEIGRQVRSWLGGLSNDRLAACDEAALRELVFSELRSWC